MAETTWTQLAGMNSDTQAPEVSDFINQASASAASALASSVSAASSATAASLSATSAANIYDNFDDRYLGSYASGPATDNDGDALLTGALYFNSSVNAIYVYNGSAWQTLSGVGLNAVSEDPAPQLGGTLDANSFNIDMGVNLITDTKVGNWDSAFGWGDHALAGYLTSYTETDPVVGAVNGLVKSNGAGSISAAVAGTDYLSPAAIGSTVQAYDADLDTWATKAAPSGDVVGTTDTQTLTNKTLTSAVLDGGFSEEVFTVTGSTPALDPANGSIQQWTLSGASTPTDSLSNGESILLMIDDGSASTVTWPAITWINNGGSAPALAATGYTVISLWKAGSVLYGVLVGDGS